jgi:Flp pilus assembly protein TadG
MNNRHISIREERGQAMTEFALVLPILALLIFGIIQFGIVFNNYLTVTDAARAGARSAIVALHAGASDGVAAGTAAAKKSADHLDKTKLGVNVSAVPNWSANSDVKVTVSYPYQVSLLGVVIKSGTLSSTTVERIE